MKFLFVSICILKKNKKLLFTKRPAKKYYGGFWEFPGGKLEANETFEDAIIRELKEELGIVAKQKDLKTIDIVNHSYDNKIFIIMNVFFLEKWLKQIKNKEIQDYKWIDIDDKFPDNFLEGGLLILKRIKNGYYDI